MGAPPTEALLAHAERFEKGEVHDEGTRFAFGGTVPARVLLFDANNTHALLQVVWLPVPSYTDDAGVLHETPDCTYAGMQAFPKGAGVSLAVVDVRTGATTAFPVYQPAIPGRRCTPMEEAVKYREAAEALARSSGLDPTRRLVPVPRSPPARVSEPCGNDAGGTFALGGARTLVAQTLSGSTVGAHGALLLGDRLVHADSYAYNPAQGASAGFVHLDAWPAGDGWVVTTLRADFVQGECSTRVGVSPVIR